MKRDSHPERVHRSHSRRYGAFFDDETLHSRTRSRPPALLRAAAASVGRAPPLLVKRPARGALRHAGRTARACTEGCRLGERARRRVLLVVGAADSRRFEAGAPQLPTAGPPEVVEGCGEGERSRVGKARRPSCCAAASDVRCAAAALVAVATAVAPLSPSSVRRFPWQRRGWPERCRRRWW